MASRTRPALSRGRIVDAAVALADGGGLESVSMRSVAATLDVVPMALYKHVRDKEDLRASMIDAVVGTYPDPPADARGVRAVRWRALAARERLAAHPWIRPAIETATRRTPVVLAYMNTVAGELAEAGASYDLIHYAMHALGHRIWGFSPEAFDDADAADAAPPDPEAVAAMAARFPHIVAVADDAARRNPSGACDADVEFAFTLDLLLDAFQRLHEQGWTSGGRSA